MPRDNEHNPDPNANAARIVRESTGRVAVGRGANHDVARSDRGSRLDRCFMPISRASLLRRSRPSAFGL